MSFWEPLLPNLIVHETEKDQRPVVYDHTGQAWTKPRPPMGFIDPNNLPRSSEESK